MPRIAKSLRERIIIAARSRCEYCLALQEMTLAIFHVDHIIPRSAGGKTLFENLCLSCPFCNHFKGMQINARDPRTGKVIRFFNPRRDTWHKHFQWSDGGTKITGVTAIGRATVIALNLNNFVAVRARSFWVAGGIHPPED